MYPNTNSSGRLRCHAPVHHRLHLPVIPSPSCKCHPPELQAGAVLTAP
jgi:hypothetical protein